LTDCGGLPGLQNPQIRTIVLSAQVIALMENGYFIYNLIHITNKEAIPPVMNFTMIDRLLARLLGAETAILSFQNRRF
jgi:hypothetical protein